MYSGIFVNKSRRFISFSIHPTTKLHRLHSNPRAHFSHDLSPLQQLWSWSKSKKATRRPFRGVGGPPQRAHPPLCSKSFCSYQLQGKWCLRENSYLLRHSTHLLPCLPSPNIALDRKL